VLAEPAGQVGGGGLQELVDRRGDARLGLGAG